MVPPLRLSVLALLAGAAPASGFLLVLDAAALGLPAGFYLVRAEGKTFDVGRTVTLVR